MSDHEGHGYDDEFERKIKRILDANANASTKTIGVRVEQDHDDDWQEVDAADDGIVFKRGGKSWYEHAHGHGHAQGGHAQPGDPPSVLLYDQRRLVVRGDVKEDFTAFLARQQIEPGAPPEPYVGLEDVWIIEFVHKDAYDVATQFYASRDLAPDPPPIGRYNPDTVRRTLDPVSLNRYYLTTSHVFFWPDGPKVPAPSGALQAAATGDDRVVVVIDTGINPDHVFLASGPGPARYLRSPADDAEWTGAGMTAGHGTGVAAVVRQRNGDAEIVGARVALGQAQDDAVEEAQVVATIDEVAKQFAADQRRLVLNLSFGGVVHGTSPLYFKLQSFIAANRRVVAAAGNVRNVNDRRPMQPAAWPITYAVASRGQNGQIHPWSNYNTPGSIWVDATRDGEVLTADGESNTAKVQWRGTSFAAPDVAATIDGPGWSAPNP